MSLLKNLDTNSEVSTDEKDSLGGRQLFESGLYPMIVSMAYMHQAKSEALGVALTLKAEDGREYSETVYITSGKEKGKSTMYTDKDGNKQYLPGFLQMNSLALLTTGKEITALDTEQKVVSIYNYDAKADVPTKVEVIMDMIGKPVYVGMIKETVNKRVKNDAGAYVDSAETRDQNVIDKFFCAKEGFEKLTTSEVKAKAAGDTIDDPFAPKWEAKNKGVTKNKVNKDATGVAGSPNKAGGAAGTSKPTNSLFGGN